MTALAISREHSFQICCSASVLTAELPGVDVGDRASKPVIGFTAIERFLNALPKSDLVDVGEDVERSVEIVQFPQRFLGLILSTGYEHPIGD
jgi:hypothetical protein